MKSISRILLSIGGVMLIVAIFVPLWSIDLQAPQYPEGLTMLIWPDGVKGDVDIINGLNHYIGMKTIHNEDFFEFKVLSYIIGFFALLSLLVAFFNSRKLLVLLFSLFVIFGILAMYDFWRWEYDYGHNLNPNAAIIVPDMAYQPPLIGYKQLLNFAAYSFPSIGGWLFIGCGALMLLTLLLEYRVFKKKVRTAVIILCGISFLSSCGNNQPELIALNQDLCDNCKMTISNGHFGAEIKTKKGRAYKFDDLVCLLNYEREHQDMDIAVVYVHDYLKDNILMPALSSFFISSAELNSPMGGHFAAFNAESEAKTFADKYHTKVKTWAEVNH